MINTLRNIFVWFYCLPISDAAFLMLLVTFVFLFLKRRLDRYPWWNPAVGIVLTVWVAMMVYATVINREAGSINQHAFVPFHSYRAVINGDNPEILRSNFMNVVLFYPAGLLTSSLLPGKWARWCRVLLTLVLYAAISAGIEYAQFSYALGRVEIDDLIHNSLGTLLGAVFGVISRSSYGKE